MINDFGFIGNLQYETSFDPHYEDNEETEKDFDEERDLEESESDK